LLLSLSLSRNVVGFLPDDVFLTLRDCLVAAQSVFVAQRRWVPSRRCLLDSARLSRCCSVCLCRATSLGSSLTTSSRLCENCATSAWPVTGSRTCGRGRSPACDVVQPPECLPSLEIAPFKHPACISITPRGDFSQILRVIPYCSPTLAVRGSYGISQLTRVWSRTFAALRCHPAPGMLTVSRNCAV